MKRYLPLRRFSLVLALAALAAGCTPLHPGMGGADHAQSSPAVQQRLASERLGTQWGEGISSEVTTVDLKRRSSEPLEVIEIRYAATDYYGHSVQEVTMLNGRIGFYVLDDKNRKWSLNMEQDNPSSSHDLYLQGIDGKRYQLCYRNYAERSTYEIVATVDGLDVLTGQAGSVQSSGYVLYPGASLCIQGFRKSQSEVAAFRFSRPQDAYASNTPAGSARNVGVIGTAVFELFNPRTTRYQPERTDGATPRAFPGDASHSGPYAPPPRYQK